MNLYIFLEKEGDEGISKKMPPMAPKMGFLGDYILKSQRIIHCAGFGTIHAEVSSKFLSFR